MSEIFTAVLSVNQLAALVHKSPASIRSDASRNPGALPPICRLPGNKRLLWRLEDVQAWLAKYVQGNLGASTAITTESCPIQRKRGRPRKTESHGA